MQKIIYFYNPNEENGYLANFSNHPIIVEDKTYKTVEHYFQAQKFIHLPKIYEDIVNSELPINAKIIASENKLLRLPNWNKVKLKVMYKGIEAKFTRYKSLQKKLISTDNALIIENSPDDFFWGCGENGTGKNEMGKLLMELRSKLITLYDF